MEEFTLGLTGAAAREALLVDGEEKAALVFDEKGE